MNATPDQARQSIVHVLNEWAVTTAHDSSRPGRLHHSEDNHRWSTTRGWQGICAGIVLTRVGRNESVLRTFRRQASLVRYAEDRVLCWKWRKAWGRRGRVRVGSA